MLKTKRGPFHRAKFPVERVEVRTPCEYCKQTGKDKSASDGKCWWCKGAGFQSSKEQLFYCIGGPHDGTFMNWSAIGGPRGEYTPFNCGWRNNETPKCVYIHDSVLPRTER